MRPDDLPLAAPEDMAALTETLVRIPSENPPGRRYGECRDALVAALEGLGLPARVVDLSAAGEAPRFAVLGEVGSGPTLHLHGHYDVVPAQDPGQFEPRREGDRLYGRGAADMKGGLAAQMFALAALQGALDEGSGRVRFVAVPDEETGGRLGAAELHRRGLLADGGVGAILAEPTGGVVWNASRGALTLRVTSRGREAHVGLQHEGRNAFEAALPLLADLAALKAEVEARRTAWALEPEAARGSILMLGGEASGGRNFNVVPATFSFTVERRFNPEEDLETERRRLLDVIGRHASPDFPLEVEVVQEGDSSGVTGDDPLCRALAASVADVTGSLPALELCPGLLETRFYAAAGVPAVAYGPGLLSVSHGPEEHVAVSRIAECAAVYAETALRLFTPGGSS